MFDMNLYTNDGTKIEDYQSVSWKLKEGTFHDFKESVPIKFRNDISNIVGLISLIYGVPQNSIEPITIGTLGSKNCIGGHAVGFKYNPK